MRLDAVSRMRCLVGVLGFLLVGCPSSQNPGNNGDTDAGVPVDGGTTATCENPIPACSVTIKYAGSGASVSLRGDFAADGWTTGIEMTKTATGFEVTLPVK